MSGENATVIIKKKKIVAGDGHHGGAWKVAYADFVTAMMAFFLLMWLLSNTSEEQRKGIADFFAPRVPLVESSGGGTQLFNGVTVFTTEKLVQDGKGGKVDDDEGDKTKDPTGDTGVAPHLAERAPSDPADADTPPRAEPDAKPDAEPKTVAEALEALEKARAEVEVALEEIKTSAADNGLLDHLTLRITPEGLVIEIADVAGQPLFDRGSAVPSEKMKKLVEMVAPIVSDLENQVAIVGHTDSARFVNPERYGNWELSLDRANAARRLLTAYGLPRARIEKVTGAADRDPLSDDPSAPQNRRIGVILLKAPAAP